MSRRYVNLSRFGSLQIFPVSPSVDGRGGIRSHSGTCREGHSGLTV